MAKLKYTQHDVDRLNEEISCGDVYAGYILINIIPIIFLILCACADLYVLLGFAILFTILVIVGTIWALKEQQKETTILNAKLGFDVDNNSLTNIDDFVNLFIDVREAYKKHKKDIVVDEHLSFYLSFDYSTYNEWREYELKILQNGFGNLYDKFYEKLCECENKTEENIETEQELISITSQAALQPCWVYLIENPIAKWYKIGITTNIDKRFSQIRNALPNAVMVTNKKFETIKDAREVESMLHHTYRQYNVGLEWFDFDDNKLSLVKNLLT